MPQVEHAGARIHWEQEGAGEPLLLIMSLGSARAVFDSAAVLDAAGVDAAHGRQGTALDHNTYASADTAAISALM